VYKETINGPFLSERIFGCTVWWSDGTLPFSWFYCVQNAVKIELFTIPFKNIYWSSKAELYFDDFQMARCRGLYFFVASWWEFVIGECGFFHVHRT
jgi:hypothetical protein